MIQIREFIRFLVITSDSDSESLHMYNMYQDDDYRTKYLIRMNGNLSRSVFCGI